MKKSIHLIFILLVANNVIFAQEKFFTRSGTLSFFSETSVENIEAVNHQASCILDTQTGEVAVSAQMKGFEFEKALMQEHFNENYVESHKFPKATFKGEVVGFTTLKFSDETPKTVEITGVLSMHGVDKQIKTNGIVSKENGNFNAQATFKVSPDDFDIKIPKAVINNISKEIEVRVHLQLEPYVQ
jgi:hypothetical protein